MIVTHSSLSWRHLALTIGLCAGLVAQPVVAIAATVGADPETSAATSPAAAAKEDPTKLEGLAYQYQDEVFTLKPDEQNVITAKFVAQLKAKFIDQLQANDLPAKELVFEQGLTATKADLEALMALFPDVEVKDKELVAISADQAGSSISSQVASGQQPAKSAAAVIPAELSPLRKVQSIPFPDYRDLTATAPDAGGLQNDIGFTGFSANFDTPELRSDGYAFGKTNFAAFPGATGNYRVLPYNFVGAFRAANDKMSQSPLYAFFVVLPQAITATQEAAQQAANNYVSALQKVTAYAPTITGMTATRQGNTDDGRQVWLFMPSAGAKFAVRDKNPHAMAKAPTLDIPITVDKDFRDLNGNLVSQALANPPSKVANDDGLVNATIFAIIPYQNTPGHGDSTINLDMVLVGNPDASKNFQYMAEAPNWAKPTVDAMNAQMNGKKMVLAEYDGTNGASWAYNFVPFGKEITDTFQVKTTDGAYLNIPITMTYTMAPATEGPDKGQYVGTYKLTPDSLKAIRARGYQPTNITVGTEYRDPALFAEAKEAAEGGNYTKYSAVWPKTPKMATLWTAASEGATLPEAGIDVTYKLPITTTEQWYTTKDKADSLQKRQGVITVEKVTQAPLTINVIDYRDSPLKDVHVRLTDAKGNVVTTNKAGEPLNLVTNDQGQIVLPNMPYGQYTVTQTDQLPDLIKPGPEAVVVDDPDDNSVTLVNKYDSIVTDLPATGSRDGLYALIGLVSGLLALMIAIMKWPLKQSEQ